MNRNSEVEKSSLETNKRPENPLNNSWQESRNNYPDSEFVPPFPDINEGLNHGKNPRKVPSVQERIKELEEEIEHAKKKLNLSLTEGQRKEVEDYIRGLEELL
ncbi:MAG: hypothetical protein LBR43_01905, partial [Spiroplasmataceae bacterium]|nr:hypothetical protein [Spiroplasmataceae bacterium]